MFLKVHCKDFGCFEDKKWGEALNQNDNRAAKKLYKKNIRLMYATLDNVISEVMYYQ